MKEHIFKSLKLTIYSIFIFAIIYPVLVWGIAQMAPGQGKVEFWEHKGRKIGAKLVGQVFDDPQYFWSRPSAVAYNAAGSGGSNKGPTNLDYLNTVQERIIAFQAAHPYLQTFEIPAEMVTASGSGLDPDITPKAAKIQVKRIASVRNVEEEKLLQLIENQVSKPVGGFFGMPKVNVLQLNLALEQMMSGKE